GDEASEEEERQRDEIDQARKQGRFHAFDERARQRQRPADRLYGIVSAFHFERDVVDEEAADQRGDRRHQEYRSDDDAKARGDGNNPDEDRERRGCTDAEYGLGPIRTGGCEPDQQPMEGNGGEQGKGEPKPGGFEQHPPKRRREHLSERLDGRVDHRRLPPLVPAPWAPTLNKASLWRYRKHGDAETRFPTCIVRVPW